MAKAVTLKNNNDEEIYPVTDISLVNGELNGARIVNASVGSDKLTPNAVWNENIKDGAVTTSKIANGAVTQDKISGGWKLIGKANGTNRTNLPLYLDKIYKAGTFKVIAGGQCNVDSWVDLRAYHGSAVGNANLIHTSYSQVSFSGTAVNGSGSDANNANFIAAGTGKPYLAFSIEATSSNSDPNWRTWTFQFGCGTWGRFGTTRECDSFNKTAFSLDSANPMFNAHIEVWWHE